MYCCQYLHAFSMSFPLPFSHILTVSFHLYSTHSFINNAPHASCHNSYPLLSVCFNSTIMSMLIVMISWLSYRVNKPSSVQSPVKPVHVNHVSCSFDEVQGLTERWSTLALHRIIRKLSSTWSKNWSSTGCHFTQRRNWSGQRSKNVSMECACWMPLIDLWKM